MSERVHVPDLIRMREDGERIVMVTAYDFTFATLVDAAGADVVLVGDSLGSVIQGYENTLPVTLEDVLYHCRAVRRGLKRALLVADLPFMSYQLGAREALHAAGRALKEGGAGAVKLEGGSAVVPTVRRLVNAEIPVMGHLGLTPQAYHRMGGHRVQARSVGAAKTLLEDAKRLEDAGAFSVVLEGIPAELARKVTEALSIPTIGIGAGPDCCGQVLVLYDLLGLVQHGAAKSPKFVKRYAELSEAALAGLQEYASEVRGGSFPSPEHCYRAEGAVTKLKQRKRA